MKCGTAAPDFAALRRGKLGCVNASEGSIIALEAPRRATAAVLGELAPVLLRGERELYCVDGGNCFDPYGFAVYARKHRADAGQMLERIFVTRAFTIHQLEAVVAEMLPPLAARRPPPMLAILGLDHLFLEETLPLAERRQVLGRIMSRLKGLRSRRMTMLLTYDPPLRARAWWKPLLLDAADRRGYVAQGKEGIVEVRLGGEPLAFGC
ncbi:MAG: hypothetical protein V2A74_12150 [bacterium]